MKVSNLLVDFVARKEGFRDTAYRPLPTDRWTVGYGFTYLNGDAVQEGDTIDEYTARQYLGKNLSHLANIIAGQLPLTPNLTQYEFDAIISLAYNIGAGALFGSNTWELLKQGQSISNKFHLWDRSGGHEVQGLLNRRLAEKEIYDNGDYTK